MVFSFTRRCQTYQWFHPIGGVRAKASPQTILNFRSAWPSEFFARNVTTCFPGSWMVPVIRPVAASTFHPSGRLSTANVIGSSPVAGIVNRKGQPGRTPKTFGPLMRGVAGGLGVRMTAS